MDKVFFLKLNESKTEIIVFAKPSLHNKLSTNAITTYSGESIELADKVKYLGTNLDKFLTL